MLIALSGAASSILAEIETNIPQKAPALFLVDIPREDGARLEALAKAEFPGGELRLVPVAARPGHRAQRHAGQRDEGDPRRRVDPARRPRADLRQRPAARQHDRRGPVVAGRLSRPAAGQHRRRCRDRARPQGRRPHDGGRARPPDRGANRLAAADRLAQPGLQLRDHLLARRARRRALHADGERRARRRAWRRHAFERRARRRPADGQRGAQSPTSSRRPRPCSNRSAARSGSRPPSRS